MTEFIIRLLKKTAALLDINEKDMIDAARTAFCALQTEEYLQCNQGCVDTEIKRRLNEHDNT